MELIPLTEAAAAAVARWFDDDAEGRRRLGFYAGHPKWWHLVAHHESRRGFIARLDGEPIGFVDLDQQGDDVNVTICVGRAFRHHGHGVAILHAAVSAARSFSGAARLVAEVEPDNLASIRACTRVGMRLHPEPNRHGELVFDLDLGRPERRAVPQPAPVHEETIDVGGVPASVYRPPGATGVLLLGHGGGHGKDSPRFVRLARQYAGETGLAVLCIDAVDHGARRSDGAGGAIPPGWHSRNVGRMVDDWRTTAAAVESIGPAVAYVGFSMGAIFGFPTVAAMPTIRAAVFVVGGIPSGGGIDDPGLGPVILDAASNLAHSHVLMVNTRADEIFPIDGVHTVFEALRGATKELAIWDGSHDDWPPDLIASSVTFLRQHLAGGPAPHS